MKPFITIIVSFLLVLGFAAPASAVYYSSPSYYGGYQQNYQYPQMYDNSVYRPDINLQALNDVQSYQLYYRPNISQTMYRNTPMYVQPQYSYPQSSASVWGNVAYGVTSALLGGTQNYGYYQQPQYYNTPNYYSMYQQTTTCTYYSGC